MKLIYLSKGRFAKVDDQDYEFINSGNWCYSHGYACKHSNGKKVYMHQVINQTPKGYDTDHLDGDGLNNTRANLATKTHSMNLFNRGLQSNNSSGFRGISWDKKLKKWHVYIGSKHTRKNLGYFRSLEEAKKSREYAERRAGL